MRAKTEASLHLNRENCLNPHYPVSCLGKWKKWIDFQKVVGGLGTTTGWYIQSNEITIEVSIEGSGITLDWVALIEPQVRSSNPVMDSIF